MFEEFNLLYTLLAVALVVGAYFYLFQDKKPSPPIRVPAVPTAGTGKKPAANVPPKQEEIPADTVRSCFFNICVLN